MQLPLVGGGNLNKQGHRGIAPEHRKCHGKFFEKDSGNTSSKKFEKRNTAISEQILESDPPLKWSSAGMPILIKSCELAPFKEPCNSRRCFDICQYACYLSCGTSSSIPKASMAEIGVPDFVRFPGMELSKSFLRSLLLKDFTCTPHPRKICRECGETTKTDLDTSHYSDAKKTHQNLSSVVFFFPYLYWQVADASWCRSFFPTAGQIWRMESHFGFAVPPARWKTTLLTRQATLCGTVET